MTNYSANTAAMVVQRCSPVLRSVIPGTSGRHSDTLMGGSSAEAEAAAAAVTTAAAVID